MKLKPVFTEKSMAEAKKGNYTFLVNPSLTKKAIKAAINSAFGVHVKAVRTVNKPSVTKRNMYGKIVTSKAVKKAIVTLAEKEKIDIFETVAKEEKKK